LALNTPPGRIRHPGGVYLYRLNAAKWFCDPAFK
jgi:hypothetical protein